MADLEPISHYDAATLGFNKWLDNEMWAQLHNPGSKMISIRMLNPLTLKSTARLTGKKDESNLKEFENFQDLRMAMVAVDNAVTMIMPWNHAAKTLANFLHTIEFGENLAGSKAAKLTFVADFVDEVFAANADAWDNKSAFMSVHEISAKWNSETVMKFANSTKRREKGDDRKDQNRKDSDKKYPPAFLCKKFNMGICDKDDEKHPAPWNESKTLKHGCSFFLKDQNKFCLKNHAKINHE